ARLRRGAAWPRRDGGADHREGFGTRRRRVAAPRADGGAGGGGGEGPRPRPPCPAGGPRGPPGRRAPAPPPPPGGGPAGRGVRPPGRDRRSGEKGGPLAGGGQGSGTRGPAAGGCFPSGTAAGSTGGDEFKRRADRPSGPPSALSERKGPALLGRRARLADGT